MPHCDDALKQIAQALAAYQKSFDGANADSFDTLCAFAGDISPWLFVCPASDYAPGQVSYCYRGSDLWAKVPKQMILAYDKQPWHKGRRNVLFANGQVTRPTEPDFRKAVATDNRLRRDLSLPEKPL